MLIEQAGRIENFFKLLFFLILFQPYRAVSGVGVPRVNASVLVFVRFMKYVFPRHELDRVRCYFIFDEYLFPLLCLATWLSELVI